MSSPFLCRFPQAKDVIQWFDNPKSLADGCRENLLASKQESWYASAWAEVLFFLKVIDRRELQPKIKPEWRDLRPFYGDDTPTLGELLDSNCCEHAACACFPTTDDNGKAMLWRLYLINKAPEAWQSHDHQKHLSDIGGYFKSGQAIFIASDFNQMKPLDGNSWQLAYELAARAIGKKDSREVLATSWLATGMIKTGAKVEAVTIGGKDNLFQKTNRRILIPLGNQKDLIKSRPKLDEHRIIAVDLVEHAWRHVTGQGVDKPQNLNLPQNPLHLHLLVGEAEAPVLSVILLLCPQKTTLWYSDKTEKATERIKKVLQSIPDFTQEVDVQMMDSHDLQNAYNTFNTAVTSETGEQLICNTGGNRLMGTAALLVAQTNRKQVVYRDLDSPPDSLVVIQFGEQNRYESADFTDNRCPFKDKINWDSLFGRPWPRAERSVEDILHMILR